jgi:hypothetical protein
MNKVTVGLIVVVVVAALVYPFLPPPKSAGILDAVIARGVDPATLEPKGPAPSISSREAAHLCIQVAGLEKDQDELTVRWYLRGKPIPADFHWKADASGEGWVQFPIAAGSLEPGEYRLEVVLDGRVDRTLKFVVK